MFTQDKVQKLRNIIGQIEPLEPTPKVNDVPDDKQIWITESNNRLKMHLCAMKLDIVYTAYIKVCPLVYIQCFKNI